MTNNDPATPEQIKKRVQEAYLKAAENHFTHRSRSASTIDYLVRDLKLYGHDAGVDFVETHLNAIVQEAVESAGCKQQSLAIPAYGFGRSAVSGMAVRLRELTALKVDFKASMVTLTWAENNPGLV